MKMWIIIDTDVFIFVSVCGLNDELCFPPLSERYYVCSTLNFFDIITVFEF